MLAMLYGVIADIHGNLAALEAVLAAGAERGLYQWICLGDIVGYGANPRECVDRVRALAGHTVQGNHDAAAAGGTSMRAFNPHARRALEWTVSQLGPDEFAYLEHLPLATEAYSGLCVHADPRNPSGWNYIDNAASAAATLSCTGSFCCWTGHTHRPALWSIPDRPAVPADRARPRQTADRDCVCLSSGQRHLVNAGSVGQPRDGDPRACFIWCEDGGAENGITLEFVRVPYDVGSAQRRIRAAGLPDVLAVRLEYGR